jgi:hypothetical protein
MSIEQRLARLERQNRHLKWAFSVCVGAGLFAGAAGLVLPDGFPVAEAPRLREAAPTVVQAGRFELLDERGKVVAAMALTREGGGVVYTMNADGALVAQMGAADDGRGVLWTYDRAGMLRDDTR